MFGSIGWWSTSASCAPKRTSTRQPPDEAIAGTRENMLRKLDAAAHPYAIIGVRGVDTRRGRRFG